MVPWTRAGQLGNPRTFANTKSRSLNKWDDDMVVVRFNLSCASFYGVLGLNGYCRFMPLYASSGRSSSLWLVGKSIRGAQYSKLGNKSSWRDNDIGHFDVLTQLVPFVDFTEAWQIWMLCSKLQRKCSKPAITPLMYRKIPRVCTNYYLKESKMAISFPDLLFLTTQWKDEEVRNNTDNNTDCSYNVGLSGRV